MSSSEWNQSQRISERVVEEIVNCRDGSDCKLIDKINVEYILNTIEKEQFAQLQIAFLKYEEKGVGLIDFVKIFTELNDFKSGEDFFYLMAIIELYQQIQQNMRLERNIQFPDFTDFHYEAREILLNQYLLFYICQYFQEKETTNYKIPTYIMPQQKKIEEDFKNVRDIDINPPLVVGKHEEGGERLNVETLKFDSKKHREDNNVKGKYSTQMKQMITLDAFSGQLNLYNTDAEMTKTIKPKAYLAESITLILSFAWSCLQQRIGACLKDSSLVFWELNDNFKFQKQFSTVQYQDDYSTDIWFLENYRMWITTNKSNSLAVWNLEEEKIQDVIPTNKYIKGTILELVEIIHLRLVAVASMDKQVTIWNFFTHQLLLSLPLKESGIHHLIYSYDFQMILTAGFEQIISIYSIHPIYYESKEEGLLIGHSSMITAVQEVSGTKVVVSADDQGTIKIWDIRNFTCLQSLNLFIKAQINSILYLADCKKLCILTSRVGFISFDSKHSMEKGSSHQQKLFHHYPIHVEYDNKKEAFVVCTTKDIRFYDAQTGKKSTIVKGLLSDSESSEITHFRFINQQSQFIISNDRGLNVLVESANTGNQIKLSCHTGEVSGSCVDYKNKQLISCGKDCSIIIQKVAKGGAFEVKRVMKNCHFGKGISLIDFSYHLNMIVTSTDQPEVFIYDYEFLRCIGSIQLPQYTFATALHLISALSLLIIASNDGLIYIISLNIKDHWVQCQVMAIIDLIVDRNITNLLINSLNQSKNNKQGYICLINNLNIDTENSNTNNSNSNSFTNKRLISEATTKNALLTEAKSTTSNNNNQQIKDFAQSMQSSTHDNNNINMSTSFHKSTNNLIHSGLLNSNTYLNANIKNSPLKAVHRAQKQIHVINQFQQINQEINQKQTKQLTPQGVQQQIVLSVDDNCDYGVKIVSVMEQKYAKDGNDNKIELKIYVGKINGEVNYYDLSDLLIKMELSAKESYESTKKNFNPSRVTHEIFKEFSEQAEQSRYKLFGDLLQSEEQVTQIVTQSKSYATFIQSVVAHKQNLHSVQVLSLNKTNYVVTSSLDGYFKIFDQALQQLVSCHVDHPLPMKWQIKISKDQEIQKKLYFATKVLDLATKKFSEEKVAQKFIESSKFLTQILQSCSSNEKKNKADYSQEEDKTLITAVQDTNRKRRKESQSMDLDVEANVKTMKDFFSPADLQFDKIKDQFSAKLRGPTLKQMEAIKRINELKSKGMELIPVHIKEEDEEIEKKIRSNEDRENVFFLLPQYRDRILKRQKEEFNETSAFQRKLESHKQYLDQQSKLSIKLGTKKVVDTQFDGNGNNANSTNNNSNSKFLRKSFKQNTKEIDNKIYPSISAHNNNNQQNLINAKLSINNEQSLNGYQNIGTASTSQKSNTVLPCLSPFSTHFTQNKQQVRILQQQMNDQYFQLKGFLSQNNQKFQVIKKFQTIQSPRRSDFFQYANQKNLFQETSEKYQAQLEELSSRNQQSQTENPEIKIGGHVSLKEENLLQSSQVDFQKAREANKYKNKIQLLKRMQEKDMMSNIIRNLDKQLSYSRHYNSSKAIENAMKKQLSISQLNIQSSELMKQSSMNQDQDDIQDIFQDEIDSTTSPTKKTNLFFQQNSFNNNNQNNNHSTNNNINKNSIIFNRSNSHNKTNDIIDKFSLVHPNNQVKSFPNSYSTRANHKHNNSLKSNMNNITQSTRIIFNSNYSNHNNNNSGNWQNTSSNNMSQINNNNFLNNNAINTTNTFTINNNNTSIVNNSHMSNQNNSHNHNNNYNNSSAVLSSGPQHYYSLEGFKIPQKSIKRNQRISGSNLQSIVGSYQTSQINISQI